MVKKNGVSFIVTVFNKEQFILSTLQSLKINRIKDSQLIIVDDGSTDSSLKIVKKFLSSNININYKLITQKNSGPSKAINNALSHVEYSHIKLVDGDDILAPNIVPYMLREMKRINVDLLYGHWAWDKDHFNFEFDEKEPPAYFFEDSFSKILFGGWGGSSNLMIKTDTFLKINGCDESVFIQDFSLPLRVSGYHLKSKNLTPFRIGLSKKIICVGPEFIEKRLINNDSQTLHDLSLAALNFLEEHPLLHDNLKKKACKKIKGRCWRWKRKRNKRALFSLDFLSYIKSYFYLKPDIDKLKYEVMNTWKNEKDFRVCEKPKVKKKILVYVGLDLLGDALIKIPFLRYLKEYFPDSHITWLAGKGNSAMKKELKLLTAKLIDNVIENANVGSKLSELFFKPRIKKKFDIVIDTQKRLLTTLIIRKIKSTLFISPSCNYFFSHIKPSNKDEENLAKELINLVFMLNYNQEVKQKKIKIPDRRGLVNNFKKKYPLSKVAICPGASVEWKRWPIENFIKVCDSLKKSGKTPVFFLGPNEKQLYSLLKKQTPYALFPLQTETKNFTPIHTILFAQTCEFGISNDTGCGHLLVTADIPTITLFGPTNSRKFAPFNPSKKNIVINAESYSKQKDINKIPFQEVIKAINKNFL